MNPRFLFVTIIFLALCVTLPVSAQKETDPDYPFAFPLPLPTEAQIEEARACDLKAKPLAEVKAESACQFAQQALAAAKLRLVPKIRPAEIPLLHKIVELNPALLLRLNMLERYFNSSPLVAPPEVSMSPITKLELTYTFSGLGGSADYHLTIQNADKEPTVEGQVDFSFSYGAEAPVPTPIPQILPDSVDSEIVQAFAHALSDLIPIQTQFTNRPCWDYYPDWTIDLTFADKSSLTLVTKASNAIGIGGPWQTEIDGQYYMQYSSAIHNALWGLFDALDLKFGETAAMGCGGIDNELLNAAYPLSATQTP